jgi:hypothetical protein
MKMDASGVRTCLVIGRGPSVLKPSMFLPSTDVVIKCKRAMQNMEHVPDKCDYLAVWFGELFKKQYKYLHKDRSIVDASFLIFDSHNQGSVVDKYAVKNNSIVMDREYLRRMCSEHSLDMHPKKSNLPTTGLVTIFEALRVFSLPVYIKGFDAMMDCDQSSKQFDDSYHPVIRCHNIQKEHQILQRLIKDYKVVCIDRYQPFFILVGNSTSIMGEGYGSFIDSFQHVVRFNDVKYELPHEDLGSRTTHHVINDDIFTSHRRPFKTGVAQIVYNAGKKPILSEFHTEFKQTRHTDKKLSTGVAYLLNLLESGEQMVHIINFDFCKDKDKAHYFNNESAHSCHDWNFESDLVNELINDSRCVRHQ